MEMTPQRWEYTAEYLRDVFGREDDLLRQLHEESAKAGLPDISISADVGRMLMILTSMTAGRLAIEVGTLGGYSAIWIARGLAAAGAGGKLITIESDPVHADFAQRWIERAGLGDRIEIRRGAAMHVLPQLAREMKPGAVDVVFLDAIKAEYPAYWKIVRPLISVGGLLLADNALGTETWIDDEGEPSRETADRFNRMIAGDPDFEAVAVPMRQGVLVARRMK